MVFTKTHAGLRCQLSDMKGGSRYVTPDIEHMDMKRDYLMTSFVYISFRVKFEGFDEQMRQEISACA
jgi:hypothetical protein